jgi:UDP:flavonoid glycosyltransferase YjiC (YdhE family)
MEAWMRVLFASWAGGGHFAPLVPIGWALRAAGHEVLVATHPSHADTVTRAGLPALPVGPDVDMFALFRAKRQGRPWRPRGAEDPAARDDRRGYLGMRDIAEAVADALADDLVAFTRSWRPDLVVYEPAALVGPLVARLHGVPAVRQLWTSDFTAPVNGFPRTACAGLAHRFGLDELDVTGDLTLDPCPPRLQVRDDLPRQPVRYIPYNGPSLLPPWLREPPRRRRVCVTWGTTLGELSLHRLRHVPRVVRALGELDAEVVVAVLESQRGLFTDLPANVRAIGPVPLYLLLPTCEVVVHQAGGGTLMSAVASGVPHVLVPSLPDQIFNAEHLVSAGVGVHITSREEVTEDEVLAGVRTVLGDPGYRRAAQRLHAEHLARPTPGEVVPVLEELALTHEWSGYRRRTAPVGAARAAH